MPMATGLRECCGILANTIGPTPAKYKALPRSKFEIRIFLALSLRREDAESWHEAQLTRVADQPALETTNFRNVCKSIGYWLVEGCGRTDDLRKWAETGLLPPADVYHERHLLNLALGHTKSAFGAMEAISKDPNLKRGDSPAKPISNEYFIQAYKLLLALVKVAYGVEFDAYFQEWVFQLKLSPKNLGLFDSLEPLSESYPESDMAYLSLSNVLVPPDKAPIRRFPYRDTSGRHRPRFFPNNRAYGPPHIRNACFEDDKGEKAGVERYISGAEHSSG